MRDLLGTVVFAAGLAFCGAILGLATVQLTIYVFELWRDWWHDRR